MNLFYSFFDPFENSNNTSLATCVITAVLFFIYIIFALCQMNAAFHAGQFGPIQCVFYILPPIVLGMVFHKQNGGLSGLMPFAAGLILFAAFLLFIPVFLRDTKPVRDAEVQQALQAFDSTQGTANP